MKEGELRCKSCGILFSQHMGLEGTCRELCRLQAENVKLKELLEKIIAFADTSWYSGGHPNTVESDFYRRLKVIEGNIKQVLKGGE